MTTRILVNVGCDNDLLHNGECQDIFWTNVALLSLESKEQTEVKFQSKLR